jgi:hypothetical protein
LALGLGVRCFVFLPPGVSAPTDWPLIALGKGWLASVPVASQISLFS